MKTPADKAPATPSPAATRAAGQPFFAKTGGGSFFKPTPAGKSRGTAGTTPKAASGRPGPAAPSQVTSLKAAVFSPSPLIAQHIAASKNTGAPIKVSFGTFASGEITVRQVKDQYETRHVEQLPLQIPALAPLQAAGIPLVLAVQITKSQIAGYVSVATKGIPARNGFLQAIQENTQVLGWRGINFTKRLGAAKNAITGGVLAFGQDDLAVRLGGFLDSKFSVGLTDDRFTVVGGGTAHIRGLQPVNFSLALRPDGKLAGAVSTGVTFKNFSGAVQLRFLNGLVDGQGDVQYTTEKLAGVFHIVLTDEQSARGIAFGALPPDQLNQAAIAQSGLQPSGETTEPKPGPRALAGTANLTFAFNDWLTGTALVVMDGAGHVTVMSEITPQKEFTLFKPKHFPEAGPKNLFHFSPTFRYGIPYLADIHVGINIDLTASATLGPALLRNITAKGTYSTDPLIFNQFSLSADLYIQAYAELVLALEAKAGLSILAHDIDVGAGISGGLVLKAYVEGTPTIGYREKADPLQGKKGEFYIQGSAVAAAQPFFVLKGYLFVNLDSPWISPVPSKRWCWPMGKKEYPLGAGWGVGLDIGGKEGYVLGSGKAPEVNLNDAKFDGSKFVDDVTDDRLATQQARKTDTKNDFNDKLKGQAPPAPPPAPAISLAGGKPGSKQKAPPDEKLTAKWMSAAKTGLEPLKQKAEKKPLDQATLTRELNKLRSRFGFTAIQATAAGDNWLVVAEMFDRNNRHNPLALKGAPKTAGLPADKAIKGEAMPGADGQTDQVRAALAALEQVTQAYASRGATEDEMTTALKSVRRKFTFKSIQLLDKNGLWHYLYELNPKGDLPGPKVLPPARVAAGSWVKNLQTNGFERVSAASSVLRRNTATGDERLTFLTELPEGGTNSLAYAGEGTQWVRSTFIHRSSLVMPVGGSAGFELKPRYRGSEYIRPNFYRDTSASRRAIVASKLPALLNPANPNEFLSEAPAALEAGEGYTQTLNGKALVPIRHASPDHDPAIAEHWTHGRQNNIPGHNTNQATREAWNKDLNTYKLMSLKANLKLGGRDTEYTDNVGINFAGPGE